MILNVRIGGKVPMDKHANCGTILPKVCDFTNHEMKSQGRSML